MSSIPLAIVLCTVPLLAQDTGPDFEKIKQHVLPEPGELDWRRIPWRAEFRDGLADAQEARKPILLWAMNGHPLGCT